MPVLNWIGKEAVVKHHKEVPFRLLEAVPELACGISTTPSDEAAATAPNQGGEPQNLIVQGDNLHALKALLPRYAGQVKCIYIDPPYNTGNEGWAYNDNVKSPEILKWLGEVVGKEGETLDRHDRWLCMMYPRLLLLKQFLREDGAIFVSIDDNEVGNLRLLMDEIFGPACFVTDLIWRSADSSNNDSKQFSVDYNHTLTYSRTPGWQPLRFERRAENNQHYKNPDNDPRGPWFQSNLQSPNYRANLQYDVITPNGTVLKAPKNGWRWSKEKMDDWIADGTIIFPGDQTRMVKKTFLADQQGIVPSNIWWDVEDTGHNRNAKYELMKIFPTAHSSEVFKTPKPTKFIEKIIQLFSPEDFIVLDSFAGSGTTGHAVLKQNAEDGGNRKFILVEMDTKIAKDVTAERVRRVAEGYTKANGERQEGLGGGFQYCRLSSEPLFEAGGPIRKDVTFAQLAEFVWFMETGRGMENGKWKMENAEGSAFLGTYKNRAVFLLYNGILTDKTDVGGNVLNSRTLEYINGLLPKFEGEKVIYGARSRFDKSKLARLGITFHQLPYDLAVKTWF